MTNLAVGDPAPDFGGDRHDGGRLALADFRGRPLVLFFYPRAFTPGCSAEVADFNRHHEEFRELGAAIVGVSTDGVERQCAFAGEHGLAFPLIADKDGAIARAYGVHRGLLGVAKRVSFLIDAQGRIAARVHYELRIGRHVQELLRCLVATVSG
ncbi:MAG: peroxiredoxin [Myxococcales bacterium]|nr:peroxiredoxin [Myxococcales bacterium]